MADVAQPCAFPRRIPERRLFPRQRGCGAEGLPSERIYKANRIETMKGPAESGQICSVGRRKIAKKIAKNKRCYANTLRPRSPKKDQDYIYSTYIP